MADIDIYLSTGGGDYKIAMSMAETNGEAWGSDKSHLTPMVDEAVRRLKRAYMEPTEGEKEKD